MLTVGADDFYAAFNGKIAFCNFYVGPDSYREELDFGSSFGYGHGASKLFQLLKPMAITDDEEGEPN